MGWDPRQKAWKVRLGINDKCLRGGTFKPKDSTPEEVERARLAAVESRRELEKKYFTIKQSEVSDLSCLVERGSSVTGVRWLKNSWLNRCAWLVRAQMKGNR